MDKKFHPASALFPLMDDAQIQELAVDIRDHGQQCPIEILDGKILDGRNRYEACKRIGIEPDYVELNLNGRDPIEYVWSLNAMRRHLTTGQKAAIGTEIEEYYAKEAKAKESARKSKSTFLNSGKSHSSKDAAKVVGVGKSSIERAKAVKTAAPDVFEKLKAGKLTVNQAHREVVKAKKRQELETKAAAVKKNGKPLDCKIILGDCIDELPKISGARLVFADPPYNIGVDYGDGTAADSIDDGAYLSWCERWIGLAVNTLTKDGSLWLMVPDEYADRVGVLLRESGLHRRAWIKWYETFGVNNANNFNRTSRHIFYCIVDPKKFVFNADAVTRPSDRQTKYNDRRASEGGKIWDDVWQIPRLPGTGTERLPDFPTQLPESLVTAIVGCASDPGDLVVDPFSGSGTTAVVCKRLSRKCIGIEKGEKFWERSNLRLATTSVDAAGAVSRT